MFWVNFYKLAAFFSISDFQKEINCRLCVLIYEAEENGIEKLIFPPSNQIASAYNPQQESFRPEIQKPFAQIEGK